EPETPVPDVQGIPSKNRDVTWFSKYNHTRKLSAANVITTTPGPTRFAISRASDILSTFLLFLNVTITDMIIKMSNIEGKNIYGANWDPIDTATLHAYIGLLLLAGVYKSYGESCRSLWAAHSGRHIFRATMSVERFYNISRVLRFDDKKDRSQRRAVDELAPIRDLWNKWVEILPTLFNVGECVTVDEQLVGFKGRCPFRQYLPSKPARYGIKIWTLCDSKSSYVYNAQVYTGRIPGEGPTKNLALKVVLDLTYGLQGQKVTCDNFFTSYNLAQLLLKRKLTMLGTVRKNKPELPVGILAKREVFSSTFYFSNETSIVSYVPKKNKQVILMSTMHHDDNISGRPDKKPEMILSYNVTKGAVDTLDQALSTYTCKRKTNRWPMIMFYNIIDVSAYNSFVLWSDIDPNWNKKRLHKRRLFLEELGMSLIQPYLEARKYQPRCEEALAIMQATQQHAQEETNPTPSTSSTPSTKRRRCGLCPSSNDNKTNLTCINCKKYICKAHTCYYCIHCSKH
ncbi:piggyBac transposable element-derived protein 4-like, partial [Erythrolamprus reginae]|uniref:piggyBac transposable element-derived protein 4-like n=1 Tax=Erythrolamprus reginae TaxID=121349 RepID=UPI00396C463E